MAPFMAVFTYNNLIKQPSLGLAVYKSEEGQSA